MNNSLVFACKRLANCEKLFLLQQKIPKDNCKARYMVTYMNPNNSVEKYNKNARFMSTVDPKPTRIKKDSVILKILNKIPFVDVHKNRAQAIGYLLYEAIVDHTNYIELFEKYELPDTFYSWFVITELHLWMWSVRAMAEGDIGRHLRNFMVEALWNDTSVRSKKLGASNPASTRMQISILAEQLQASLIAYDEGLQSDDVVLAGALWRRFYQQEEVDPLLLDSLVKYVRKQIRALDSIPSETVLSNEVAEWEPIKL